MWNSQTIRLVLWWHDWHASTDGQCTSICLCVNPETRRPYNSAEVKRLLLAWAHFTQQARVWSQLHDGMMKRSSRREQKSAWSKSLPLKPLSANLCSCQGADDSTSACVICQEAWRESLWNVKRAHCSPSTQDRVSDRGKACCCCDMLTRL